MRWRGRRHSSNIEDRRGRGGKVAAGGGLGFIIVAIIVGLMGGDPTPYLSEGISRTVQNSFAPSQEVNLEQQQEMADFTAVVLADTEDVWRTMYPQNYREPKLVMFTGLVQSACGRAQAAMGPFYCPSDNKVYIDLSFYNELRKKLNAPGDFAQAYVIAHEVGHHVQNQLGILPKVHQMQRRVSKKEANQLSVRLELQADCFAGLWAHHADKTKNILERGDIDEALRAAQQIGDDMLQKSAQGYVVPDSFTHGSAAQRQKWFKRGFDTGDMQACDTFSN